jgi:hypothetical protein
MTDTDYVTLETKFAPQDNVGKKKTVALVRERTILTKQPPLAGEISTSFCR